MTDNSPQDDVSHEPVSDDGVAFDVLAREPLSIVGRMPNSSNATFLVTLGETDTRGIYKPLRGERPLWDFDPGLYKHEIAAYRVSRALDWNLVPPTVPCDGPLGEGSLQMFVDFDPAEHYFTIFENHPEHHDNLRKMAVFDIVTNNTDRKGGHVLLDEHNNIWGIDHGVCFSPDFKLRTVIWEFAGDTIADEWLAPLEQWLTHVPLDIAALLNDDEIDAMCERIAWLVEHRVLPAPSSRYEYPWPLL